MFKKNKKVGGGGVESLDKFSTNNLKSNKVDRYKLEITTKNNNSRIYNSFERYKFIKNCSYVGNGITLKILAFLSIFVMLLVLFWFINVINNKNEVMSTAIYEMDAPILELDNGFQLYFEDDTLTYGSSNSVGQNIDNLNPFNIGISNEAMLPSYYIRVLYKFDSSIINNINFANNSYAFNGVTMSPMLFESSTNQFLSTSLQRVNKGSEIDILAFLRNFAFDCENDFITDVPLAFSITIVVDQSSNFNTAYKNQLVYKGEIGFNHNKNYTLDPITLNMNGGEGDLVVNYQDNQFKITGNVSSINNSEFYFFSYETINSNEEYFNLLLQNDALQKVMLDRWYDLPSAPTTLNAVYLTPNIIFDGTTTSVNINQYSLNNNIEYAIIGSGYETIIGDNNNNNILKDVLLPCTINSIEGNAFANCVSLKYIELTYNIVSIAGGAFYSCSSLESIFIPYNVESIGTYVFSYCANLENIAVDMRNTNYQSTNDILLIDKINNTVLAGANVENIRIPQNIIKIEDGAFEGRNKIINVILNDGLTTIGYYAFSGCNSLSSLVLYNTVNTISDGAFYTQNNLTYLYYGGTQEELDNIENFGTANEGLWQNVQNTYYEGEWEFDQDGNPIGISGN